MDGTELEEAEVEKDLGVWVESSMKPTLQCERAAKNANSALGLITRSFHFRKAANLVPLYQAFVRPQLEYAGAAWSPWMEQDIAKLEKVQQRLVKMISDKRGETYEERLENIGLTMLRQR